MPVSEKRLYNPERLNRWFAVSSILMTASILWMIQVDYDRPWRGFQDRFFTGKAALAHLDYLDAMRQERVDEVESARRRAQDARDYRSQVDGSRRAEVATGLAEAEFEFKKADGPWSQADQVLQVTRDTYERMLGIHGADHPRTEAAHQQLLSEEDLVDSLRIEKESWEDRKKQLEAELKDLDAPVRIAEKRLGELEARSADALARDQQYRGVLADDGILGGLPVIKTLINMPLLDFSAPKNTPARHQINQLVLPDVRQRLNYLESYTTDRCTTCHVAIDDPQFSVEHLAAKLERSLPGIDEALQRAGKSPLGFPAVPDLLGSDKPLVAGRVTDHWDQLEEDQQDEYFEALLAKVNEYLASTGRKTIDLGQPLLAHSELDLYVSIDSPHPANRVGCTVCHEGSGQETDFVQAAHTPATHAIRKDWEEKYYVRRVGLPTVTFETIEHYWDRPMRLPRYAEAGCAKCHSEITDIARFEGDRKGARINLGRHLFTNVGCINCHNVDAIENPRRVGPDLTYVAEKLVPEFVQQWVFEPQKFRPSTRMPHFFQQENNRAQSANSFDPDPLVRTQTEVAAVSGYLFTVSQTWHSIDKPESVVGDADRGKELFAVAGCLACHANLTEFGEQWVTKDISERTGVDIETARHQYLGMSSEDRTRYAMKHFVNERDSFLHPQEVRFDPDGPYQTPILTRFAPELSGIGSKVSADWLYSWLIDPTRYSPDTKMPRLRLSPPEAADLTAYLMTLTNGDFEQGVFELNSPRQRMADQLIFTLLSAQRSETQSQSILKDAGGELTDLVVEMLTPALGDAKAKASVGSMGLQQKKMTYLGNKMIGHYGCYACHRIPGFESTTPPGTDLSTWAEKPVAQLDFAFYGHAFHGMREEQHETYSPIYPHDAKRLNLLSPIDDRANEEITHTHAAFALHKLLNPRIWDRGKIKRPYDKLKMPNFYFSEEEAEALTTYLLSRIPARVNDVLKVDYEGNTLGPIARGRNLTRELNCVACHEVEDNVPTIQQYFRRQISGQTRFDALNAPPSLWGEGAKVQHNWLHRFLQHVEPLRPWLEVRMPSFNLTGEEATTLVEYLAALSRRDSSKLAEAMDPVDEYMEGQRQRAEAESQDSETVSAAGSDWYLKESLRSSTAHSKRWAIGRKLIRESELDPLRVSPDRLRKAHADLYTRVDYMQKLYDVEYPFVEPPAPLSSSERFASGKQFFNDMGCLQCHVLGPMLPGPASNTDDFVQMYRLDGVRGEGEKAVAVLNGTPYPVGSVIDGHTLVEATNTYYESGDVETKAYIEGPNAQGENERIMLQAATAPNLSLTYQRLRRAWVSSWMLEPQWIQPGTKMPQNFPGGISPFEGDSNYPGTGKDHIDLLVDFLYHAGATSTRSPLPKIVATDTSEDFDEDGGEADFDEEEFDD